VAVGPTSLSQDLNYFPTAWNEVDSVALPTSNDQASQS